MHEQGIDRILVMSMPAGPSLVTRCFLTHVVHRGPGYNSKDAGFLYLASGGGRHETYEL